MSASVSIRLLHVLAASAILLPALLFAYASLLSYRQAQTFAEERIERSLDVMQEQALKTFQSMNLAIDSIAGLLANLTSTQIQADAARSHERLKQIHSALPEVQSIWVFGPTGHPLIITRE
jgi:two-component system NtrC family sensor kinase